VSLGCRGRILPPLYLTLSDLLTDGNDGRTRTQSLRVAQVARQDGPEQPGRLAGRRPVIAPTPGGGIYDRRCPSAAGRARSTDARLGD